MKDTQKILVDKELLEKLFELIVNIRASDPELVNRELIIELKDYFESTK